jgi:hypothetical protein
MGDIQLSIIPRKSSGWEKRPPNLAVPHGDGLTRRLYAPEVQGPP